jgi:hypothetical protein
VGEGVKEKLRRAHMHREDVQRRVERFVHSDAYGVLREDDGEAGERRWRVQIRKQPPLVEWAALIGECLFNFRSALDHLAYDLAAAHSGLPLDPEVEEGSEFPIFWKRAPTQRELQWRIGAVHPEARRLIKEMQPYGRKGCAALKYLDALHNFDKHRTVLLVVSVSTGFAHFGEMDFKGFNFGHLKDGDVLALIPLTDDPERQQDPSFMFGVAFGEGTPGAKAPDVATTLSWIGQHIEGGVIEPLLPYL